MHGFFNTVGAAEVFKGVAKAVKNFSSIFDADLFAKVGRKPVAEVAAAFAARIDFKIREQIAALTVFYMFHKSAGNQNGMNRNVSPGMAVFELCTRLAKI